MCGLNVCGILFVWVLKAVFVPIESSFECIFCESSICSFIIIALSFHGSLVNNA